MILKRVLAQKLNNNSAKPGKYKSISGVENIEKVINIDQSPIGRTPRSNPATYTGVFDDIRELFAQTNQAKAWLYLRGVLALTLRVGAVKPAVETELLKLR